MKNLYIIYKGKIYYIEPDNIYRIFLLMNEKISKKGLQESVQDFLVNLINPLSYIKEDEFIWKGNKYYSVIIGRFE